MQININYIKISDVPYIRIGDLLSNKKITGKVIKVFPKESTGWGIRYSFEVENEYGRKGIISREI